MAAPSPRSEPRSTENAEGQRQVSPRQSFGRTCGTGRRPDRGARSFPREPTRTHWFGRSGGPGGAALPAFARSAGPVPWTGHARRRHPRRPPANHAPRSFALICFCRTCDAASEPRTARCSNGGHIDAEIGERAAPEALQRPGGRLQSAGRETFHAPQRRLQQRLDRLAVHRPGGHRARMRGGTTGGSDPPRRARPLADSRASVSGPESRARIRANALRSRQPPTAVPHRARAVRRHEQEAGRDRGGGGGVAKSVSPAATMNEGGGDDADRPDVPSRRADLPGARIRAGPGWGTAT